MHVAIEHHCDPDTEFDCTGAGEQCVLMTQICDRRNDCGNDADEDPLLCQHVNGISIITLLAFVQRAWFPGLKRSKASFLFFWLTSSRVC